jgi:hypothetical protein
MNNTYRCTRRWVAAATAVVLIVVLLPCAEGLAQKKKTTTKQESSSTEQQVVSSAGSKASGATIKDFLAKFKGSRTTLGILSRLESDHFVVDDDGTVAVYPYAVIRSIKLLKVEEGEENPVLLDISIL